MGTELTADQVEVTDLMQAARQSVMRGNTEAERHALSVWNQFLLDSDSGVRCGDQGGGPR